MAVRTKVEPIDRDVRLIIDELLSPAAQSAQFASGAGQFIAEADETNRRVLGRIPPRKTFVDGREGAALETVRPGGVIVAEWELITDVLLWIAADLIAHSPVGRTEAGDKHPGLYKKSHTLFADATEVSVGEQIPPASEYVFMNMLSYSRKIERGSSRQFDRVYEGTAQRARGRFGNVAKIYFTFRGVVGGQQVNPMLGGATGLKRGAKGRFTARGGVRAHNNSDLRFPVITVRIQ